MTSASLVNDVKWRILVTGSSGFIGTNLVDELMRQGHLVMGIDIVPPKIDRHIEVYKTANLLDASYLGSTVSEFKPEFVVHLGARTDLDGVSVDEYKANHEGTRNILNISNDVKSVKKVIFASSRLVNRIGYTPKSDIDYCPTTAYGESKVLGEKIIRERSGLNYEWCIVRPTSIWGPWFGVPYRNFFDAVISGRYIHPRGQKIYKSFGYVGNAVFELISLLKNENGLANGETFYLSDYDPIEVFDFAKKIRIHKDDKKIKEASFFALKVVACFGDVLKSLGVKNPPLTSFRLDNLVTPMTYDTGNLFKIVGRLPFNQDEGVARTIGWMNGFK